MIRWICGSFLLVLAVNLSTAESVRNVLVLKNVKGDDDQNLQGDTGKLDYESALRPAVLQKRSIANIARLLLGVGNAPPNHPLVKYPEPKSWNLANNIVASLPAASSMVASAAHHHHHGGWEAPRPTALQNIQQLFETKAKIIPYTGQVVTGVTGLASVKGDLLRQIHSISTQAIAQAAAEAAARALASAAAAHAVTNSIAHSVNPGAHTGIKGGWSSYQNVYANAPGKTPGEQPGPPYQTSSDSAHINHYQPPPSYNSNPFSIPATTPSPVAPTLPPYQHQSQQNDQYLQQQSQYQSQSQNQNNNGYYTLYNTQPATSAHAQVPYTPAPPGAPARPTLSPNTLVATTPSGYSPSLSKPFAPFKRGRVMLISSSYNNIPLTSFRRAVPAGIFGRYAAQPTATPSLLASISSLLSASTAAYNAAFAASNPAPTAVFSNLLPSASAPIPTSSILGLRPGSPIPAPTVFRSEISSAASNQFYNPELQQQSANLELQQQSANLELQRQSNNLRLQQQSVNPIPQVSSNYGSPASSISSGQFHQQQLPGPVSGYNTQASAPAVNPPSNTFSQHATSYLQTNNVQSGANPYTAQSVQSPQFSGLGGAASPGAGANNYGGYSNNNVGASRPGYSGYNGGSGSSNGYVSGWNTQHAGSPASAAPWASSTNQYPSGYAGQATGNTNYPSGSGGPAQFPIASGSAAVQQTYSAPQTHTYQPPATHAFAQAQPQPQPSIPYPSSSELNPQYPQYSQNQYTNTNNARADSVGGVRNSNLNYQQYDSQDLRQSASTMGNDYDDDHSYQPAPQRRNRPTHKPYSTPRPRPSSSSRYPRPSKKRPTKRPMSHSYKNGNRDRETNNFVGKEQQSRYNVGKEQTRNNAGNTRNSNGEYDGPRVYKTGSKKGSQFDSSVDVEVVDDAHDDYVEGDQFYEVEEIRSNPNTDPDDTENRWRTQDSSGQPPNSIHNHHSNGRWKGKQTHAKQAPSKNVGGRESERFIPQPGRPKGSSENIGNQKSPSIQREERVPEKKQRPGPGPGGAKPRPRPTNEPKTEAAQLYRGRLRDKQQQQYESRDIYTTLPQYVFRVDERPDVFLRPGRKPQLRTTFWGRLKPRVGETNGDGGSSSGPATLGDADNIEAKTETAIPQTISRKVDPEDVEEPSDSPGPFVKTAPRGGEEEVLVSVSKALDETARADVLSGDAGFITSEELDPEEREAFVDDVYADDHLHRRQDYDDGDDEESVNNTDEAVDEVEK